MSDELLKVEKVIHILHPPVCRSCGGRLHYRIKIVSIEAQDTHWDLRGKGKLEKNAGPKLFCPECGSILETLEYMIPIECASFSCPNCGQLQHLEYKIQRIEVANDAFQFEAKITCRKCGNTKSFKEVIKKILGVLKITVGPTGVTVSTN